MMTTDPVPKKRPFHKMKLEDKYSQVKRWLELANESIEKLHGALNLAGSENRTLVAQLANCEQNLRQQEQVVLEHITASAETERALVEEIVELKAELKAKG